MKRAIIVDLDGTLYNCEVRREKFLSGKERVFDKFNAAAIHDPPHSWCVQLVHAMRNAGAFPIFVSGREATYLDDTVKWLKKNLNMHRDLDYHLYMRPAKDYGGDAVIKRALYDRHIKDKFEVVFAVDDRQSVVDLWRSLGITTLQCAKGDF